MPNYLYKCKDCGNQFEVKVRVEDIDKHKRELKCIKCKSKNVVKDYSGIYVARSESTSNNTCPTCNLK